MEDLLPVALLKARIEAVEAEPAEEQCRAELQHWLLFNYTDYTCVVRLGGVDTMTVQLWSVGRLCRVRKEASS